MYFDGVQLKPLAGEEWASGDTAYAAMDMICALKLIGDPGSRSDQFKTFLKNIKWESLLLNQGADGICHGYDYLGNKLSSAWKSFGMEMMGVNWAYSSARAAIINDPAFDEARKNALRLLPACAEMSAPPTDNGSGFIDNACYPVVFSGKDKWKNDWDKYRSDMANKQTGWFTASGSIPNTYLGDAGLFGLSAAETPEGDGYIAYGAIDASYNQDVLILHYPAMISDIRKDDALRVWEVLRDTTAAFLAGQIVISPLNNMESMRVDDNLSGRCTINHLKSSWNMCLQAEGWAIADANIKNNLVNAITSDGFLNVGLNTLSDDTVPPQIAITSPLDGENVSKTGFTVHGTASDDKSGVKQIQVSVTCLDNSYPLYTYSLDSVIEQPASYDFSAGTWSFYVAQENILYQRQIINARAQDNFGNWSGWVSVDVPEKIAPTASIITPPENEPVSAQVEYFMGAADDASGIKNVILLLVRRDEHSNTTILQFVNAKYDASKKIWSYPIPYDKLYANVSYDLSVYIVDNCGNRITLNRTFTLQGISETVYIKNSGFLYNDLNLPYPNFWKGDKIDPVYLYSYDTRQGVMDLSSNLAHNTRQIYQQASPAVVLTSSPTFRMTFKIDSASLAGDGWYGIEAPINLNVYFLAPDGTIKTFSRMYNIADDADSAANPRFEKTAANTWVTKTFTLENMGVTNRYSFQKAEVFSNGWARKCYVDSVEWFMNDTVAPEIAITSPVNYENVSGSGFTISGTVSDNYSGVREVLVSVKCLDYTFPTQAYDLDTVVDQPAVYDAASGTWSFYVAGENILFQRQILTARARDNFGNWSGAVSVQVPENISPTGTITVPGENLHLPTVEDNLTGTADDAMGISNVTLLLTCNNPYLTNTVLRYVGAAYDPESKIWSYPVPRDKINTRDDYTLEATILDNSGNRTIVKRTFSYNYILNSGFIINKTDTQYPNYWSGDKVAPAYLTYYDARLGVLDLSSNIIHNTRQIFQQKSPAAVLSSSPTFRVTFKIESATLAGDGAYGTEAPINLKLYFRAPDGTEKIFVRRYNITHDVDSAMNPYFEKVAANTWITKAYSLVNLGVNNKYSFVKAEVYSNGWARKCYVDSVEFCPDSTSIGLTGISAMMAGAGKEYRLDCEDLGISIYCPAGSLPCDGYFEVAAQTDVELPRLSKPYEWLAGGKTVYSITYRDLEGKAVTENTKKPYTLTLFLKDPAIAGNIKRENISIYKFDQPNGSTERFAAPGRQIAPANVGYEAVSKSIILEQVTFGAFAVAMFAPPADSLDDTSCYPSPFDPAKGNMTIQYYLNNDPKVTVSIYDLLGNLAKRWEFTAGDTHASQGLNQLAWDGKNGQGETVASGGYIASIQADGRHKNFKFLVLK